MAIDAKTAVDAKVAAAGSADAAAGSANAAGNSASAAARSEQAAGASEVKAAESEKAAKASEQAAAESAQAALESKTAAATSEVNAAASAKKAQDVADSLPEDYTTAVNDIATLKQQVANITPDDSAIGGKPWSSKNIVDMLCPPLEESGNPVVCYPVAGYPLGVKAKWEPMQEGTGTPSPENIRPIKGRDSVRVERCGENLLAIKPFNKHTSKGITYEYVPDGGIHVSGTTAPTTYTPYIGQTNTLTLPETVYGGEVDAVTGDGQETWKILTLDGTGRWMDNGSVPSTKQQQWALYGILEPYSAVFGISSHFDNQKKFNEYLFNFVRISSTSVVLHVASDGPFATVNDLKSYLAAQKAAGTPVQIAYKLSEPVPFTATGAQPIPALAGTNTVLTDADSATVTGRADPIKRITDLEDAVASQT